MVVRLYGRARAVELLRAEMLRAGVDADGFPARRPILLFEGGPGSGKTAVLDSLEGLLTGRAPYAYLDLEAAQGKLDESGIPELLAVLATYLARQCEPYGRLEFRRLAIGHVVMNLTLDRVNPYAARREVSEAVKKHRGVSELTEVLQDSADAALGLVPGPVSGWRPLVSRLLAWLVDGLLAWTPLRRRILGQAQEWYGHQDQADSRLHGEPVDALIQLNHWARNPAVPAHRRRVQRVLWNAFLADLRDNFENGRHCAEWPYNAVLLLDNVDSELGRTFLVDLVQAHGLSTRDPLTIVAASAGGLAGSLDDSARAAIREAGHEPAGAAAAPQWLRYRLRDLTPSEVGEMVAEVGLSDAAGTTVTANVHQLTGGQPAATRLLVDAIPTGSDAGLEVAALLRSRRSGHTVEAETLRILLGRVRADVVAQLVPCAAARNVADGHFLASQPDLVGLAGVAEFPAELWLPAADARPTLLRRLLLRQLASQDRGPEPGIWARAHEPLLRRSQRRGDLAGQLHYTLAGVAHAELSTVADALDRVTRELTDRLKDTAAPDWLRLLRAVCWAPRPDTAASPGADPDADPAASAPTGRPSSSPASPEAAARQLLRAVAATEEPFGWVLAVVSRLWIASDPLCGSDRATLYAQLAGALRRVMTVDCVDDTEGELFAAVQRYEDLARSVGRAFGADHPEP